jgi:hypothetical protein
LSVCRRYLPRSLCATLRELFRPLQEADDEGDDSV